MDNTPYERMETLAFRGKDYDFILADLKTQSLPEDVFHEHRRAIDELVVRYELARADQQKNKSEILMGGVVLVIGLTITFGTFISGASSYVLAFGAILGGAWVMKEGYKKYRTPLKDRIVETPLSAKRRRFDRF